MIFFLFQNDQCQFLKFAENDIDDSQYNMLYRRRQTQETTQYDSILYVVGGMLTGKCTKEHSGCRKLFISLNQSSVCVCVCTRAHARTHVCLYVKVIVRTEGLRPAKIHKVKS